MTDPPNRLLFDRVLSLARADARIRAVILNGSRANPAAKPDRYQDWDLVVLVTEIAPFIRERSWLDALGARALVQTPDDMGDKVWPGQGRFAYLIQFLDGTRLDLTLLAAAEYLAGHIDSLSVVVLDKDGLLPPLPPPSDADHRPRPFSARGFAACCNEFWWVSVYVAKGLLRDELPYARLHLEGILRPELHRMLDAWIGARTGGARGAGKMGKALATALDAADWALYLATCAGPSQEAHWHALDACCALFAKAARAVAAAGRLRYPDEEEAGARVVIAGWRSA
ncbi:MAG: aminoglycoside 6-adenylyltransferase [Thermoflexales bacterium]|nr:aminoglycoside 6-adenylyltransferase [Thermoflexales bacterium]